MSTVTNIEEHIRQIWSGSAFMQLLKIKID